MAETNQMSSNASSGQSSQAGDGGLEVYSRWIGSCDWPSEVSVSNFSLGELLDRLSILRIKLSRCAVDQRAALEREYRQLCQVLSLSRVAGALLDDWLEPVGWSEFREDVSAETPEAALKKLARDLYRSNLYQWELEDEAERLDREGKWETCSAAQAAFCRVSSRIRQQNRRRVALRRCINQFCLEAARTGPSLDCRVYRFSV